MVRAPVCRIHELLQHEGLFVEPPRDIKEKCLSILSGLDLGNEIDEVICGGIDPSDALLKLVLRQALLDQLLHLVRINGLLPHQVGESRNAKSRNTSSGNGNG